jgi:hypothetical protein
LADRIPGERALTGLLAAAAWQVADGWSLEEFLGLRRAEQEGSACRGGLWFGIGMEAYTAEAKVCWPQEKSEAVLTQIRAALQVAKEQLRHPDEEFRYRTPLARCFAVPDLHVDRWSRVSHEVDDLFAYIAEGFAGGNTVVATSRSALPEPPVHEGRYYPGVVLIGPLSEITSARSAHGAVQGRGCRSMPEPGRPTVVLATRRRAGIMSAARDRVEAVRARRINGMHR